MFVVVINVMSFQNKIKETQSRYRSLLEENNSKAHQGITLEYLTKRHVSHNRPCPCPSLEMRYSRVLGHAEKTLTNLTVTP